MKEKSPIAVIVALIFTLALASAALVADAAGPASRDYDKMQKPVAPAPINPNVKAWVDNQKSPNQPAKPAQPQAVKPAAPSGQPSAPAQPPRPYVKSPGPQPQDPKKNATFVNKVNTAPSTTPASKRPETGYSATKELLGR